MSSLNGVTEMRQQSKLAGDLVAWGGNVSTSVLIVFINKVLMKTTGYGFHYGTLRSNSKTDLSKFHQSFPCPTPLPQPTHLPRSLSYHTATTLTALHFLVCTLSIWAIQHMGYIRKTTMPKQDLWIFTFIADISILTLNLSLMLNTVSFYQIAKLLIIPFVCAIERFYLGRVFTREVVATIGLVILGVAIVTIEDLQLDISPGGLIIAGISVVSSGLQQIFVRTMQQKHKLTSHELLSNTAPAQAWSLIFVGPFIDRMVTQDWVFSYSFTTAGAFVLAASCSLAVLVNLSQFMCLGRFSAVSFQVLGHSKTVLVLMGGWLFLGDTITARKAIGMSTAVAGMVWYGKASSAKPSGPTIISRNNSATGTESSPLLGKLQDNNLNVLVSNANGTSDVFDKRMAA